MLTEAAITKVLTSIASKVGYDLTKLGAGKVKELFQKEGYEIDENEAEKIVEHIRTGDFVQQNANGEHSRNINAKTYIEHQTTNETPEKK